MNEQNKYDACIIGGGLAGLALSIQLARQGYSVALFEKEKYPFHKVCGEYISFESWNFLEGLGIPLSDLQLPMISNLIVSAPNGKQLKQDLPLGGFGISRYKLDAMLKGIAEQSGVTLFENNKVTDVNFLNEEFLLQTTQGKFTCFICCGSYGKRSNLDIKWNRTFVNKKPGKLNNYLAVKYHIKTNFPADSIALHNFKDGYCGISGIEDGKYCFCYLTNAENLKVNGNSIEAMEKNVLYKNPHLKNIFENSEILYDEPLTISQISFEKKTQVENHMIMLGDAAGMITPLCGNGMSMALYGSKITFGFIQQFLKGNITRQQMESDYILAWRLVFEKRLRTGRLIQSLFGKIWVTNIFIAVMKRFPALTKKLIEQTHGEPF